MIQSPLNYTGGKYRLLPQLLPLFPDKVRVLLDIFCGGGNVGANANCERIWFNDINNDVIQLLKLFANSDPKKLISSIEKIICKFGLSDVSKYGYEYYGCSSSEGVAKYNESRFNELRSYTNSFEKRTKSYYTHLYVLIVYAFNNHIRFNSSHAFNLPVGKRDFNKKMKDKLMSFCEAVGKAEPLFTSKDFRKIDISVLTENDFVYADPPYLITCATYNEQGGWTEKDERDLLNFLDNLHQRNIKFALSNVLTNKGKTNEILIEWLERNPQYNCTHLKYDYANSNYHKTDSDQKSDEVLIRNYM